jgi:hypothetical protein
VLFAIVCLLSFLAFLVTLKAHHFRRVLKPRCRLFWDEHHMVWRLLWLDG